MKISILIPCYNEEKTIRACLESCMRQSRKADEIIVIDDGSTDRTSKILATFKDKIRVVRTPRNTGNKSKAQEFGLRFVKGDVFVTTDADTLIHYNFLERIEMDFMYDKVIAVAGYVRSLRHNWLTACREIDYVMAQEIHKKAQSYINAIYVMPGCSSAFRTQFFRKYITFDHDTLTEDLDFTYKLHEMGFKIRYDSKAIVYTQDPATLKAYMRQMSRWYSGGWQNLSKHKGLLFKKSGSALEISLSYAEGLALSMMLIILPIINLPLFGAFMLLYLASSLIISTYAAIMTKRYNLIAYFPLHTMVGIINSMLILKTFLKEVIFRKKSRKWFKPERRSI
jgi:cellulose synthase/poly-beta-1,6-N-acetylglucosamine synthase-like glycosyltransferase